MLVLTAVAQSGAQAANNAAPVKKPPPPPDYFPLRVNDWWKYQSTTGEGKVTKFDIKVISAEKQPDETIIYAVDTTTPNAIHDWYSKQKGQVLRHKEQYGDNANMVVNYDPLFLFIQNPLWGKDKDGNIQTWQWKGKGMMNVDIEENATVSGPEDVFVPAGKFSCMKVSNHVKQGGAEMVKTFWFANWVGLIKSSTQSGPVGSVTELMDWSFKPKPKPSK